MAKIKKAQDGWIMKAACRRGVCGKGSVSDKRAARMDRKEQRSIDRETRREDRRAAKEQRREDRYWRQSNLKKGGKVKKAQNGILSYKTPTSKVSMDTTGYAAGKKKFPTKVEGQTVGLYGRMKPATVYGMANRKNATRAIAKSQGKSTGRVGISPTKKAKKSFPQSKSGSKISKKK